MEEHEIKVTVGGNNAVIQENAEFLYVDRWSDPNTWWGESPPRK